MTTAMYRLVQSTKLRLITLYALMVLLLVLTGCGPCNSVSGITGIFSSSQKEKSDRSKKENKKDKQEEEAYQTKLKKMLDDPSFVFVSANPEDKGATAVVKSEDDGLVTSLSQDVQCSMVTLHPEGKKGYITSTEANKILVIDAENHSLIKTIETKDEPYGIAASPDGKSVYITHYKSNYISKLDTSKDEIVKTIEVKDHPACVTISFDGKKAYVGHAEYIEFDKSKPLETTNLQGSNAISVIDLTKEKETATITTKGTNWSIAILSDGSKLFATTYEPFVGSYSDSVAFANWSKDYWNGVTVVDTKKNAVIKEVPIDEHISPRSIALTPDNTKAYIVGSTSDNAQVLDVANQAIKSKIALGIGG